MRFNYRVMVYCAMCAVAATATSTAQSLTKSDDMSQTGQSIIVADDMPQSWQYTEGYVQTLPTSDNWWREFNDPVLDSLIYIGVNNNYDVLAASRRIEIARQSLRQVESAYYPTVTASAGWSAQRNSGMTASTAMNATNLSYFNLGVDMNWEIDIFGKIKAQSQQSKTAYRASRIQYDAMMVSICSKIASAYMQLRALQAQLGVLQQHIERQKKVSDITEARHEAGLASMLDVSQSLTTYYATLASVTNVENAINTTINTIATLTATYPADIAPLLSKPAPMPDYKRIVAVGVPMELLRRRPDIVVAETQLAGYAAALGVAKKDFLPTLSLRGSVGTTAHKATDVFDSRAFTYAIAPTLSWTIFDGMGRKAAEAAAKEQMLAGIDNYNATVLTAVQEVENAMSTYYNSLKYIDMLQKVTKEADQTYNLSIDLYKQGLTAFINVTTAQITYLQYSNELVSAQGSALTALVNLYGALGGGWSVDACPADM